MFWFSTFWFSTFQPPLKGLTNKFCLRKGKSGQNCGEMVRTSKIRTLRVQKLIENMKRIRTSKVKLDVLIFFAAIGNIRTLKVQKLIKKFSRFEQFHFLCRAVDFVKKVSRKRVSSNRISSRWSWPLINTSSSKVWLVEFMENIHFKF